MIVNVNHFSFTVDNLNKSIEFYRDVLGLELLDKTERSEEFSSSVTGVEGATLKIAYMKASNCCIELIEYTSAKGIKLETKTCNTGSSHICFNVEDFDKWINNLKNNNVKFSGEICSVPEGPNKGKKVVYCEDIDGNTLEFIANHV